MLQDRQRFYILASPLVFAVIYSLFAIGPSVHRLHVFLNMVNYYSMPVFLLSMLTGCLILSFNLMREARSPQRRTLYRFFIDIARRAAHPAHQITGITPPIIFVLLMATGGMFKQIVLPASGYWSDPLLMTLDQRLLGGHNGWEITHAMLSPSATLMLDWAYQIWFVPMVGSMLICSYLSGDPLHRCRFMLCFIASWIIAGSALAYLLPAAGPVYFGYFHPAADPFLALNAKLADDDQILRSTFGTGLFALQGQTMLLESFKAGEIMPGGGISAMPSMHNAVAVLLACAGFGVHRMMGWVLSAFALVIFVGSVHLGWHYAIDGIVAAIVSCGLWASSGAILRRYERRKTERRSNRIDGGRRMSDRQLIPEESRA
jgi:hypothetical protein